MTACIIADETVPNGIFRAYDIDGRLVCELQLAPVYMATTFLSPPEPDIATWRVSPETAVRYASMKSWYQFGHYVMGRA